VPCAARLDLVGWATSDGVACPVGTGVIPPQLVPEHLVSSENTVLSLFELTNVLLITRSRLPASLTGSRAVEEDVRAVGQASELFEQASELLERVSELFN
jgi:hypothetical protein